MSGESTGSTSGLPDQLQLGVDDVSEGRRRVIIEGVSPEIDCGRFAAKYVVGDQVQVEADIFTDSHDEISAIVRYRRADESDWTDAPMHPLVNDRWRGDFNATELGQYVFTLQGWVDHFKTWRRDIQKKADAGQDISVDVLIGIELIEAASDQASGDDADILRAWARSLREEHDPAAQLKRALEAELDTVMARNPDKRFATIYARELPIVVDRERARFSTWYEMFPRSCSPTPGQHGTLKDCEARLPYIASMGFDVLYLPPIFPIGRTHRKGKNNAPSAQQGEPGSPWAIGSDLGGHTTVHPDLGTLDDFKHLVATAQQHGIEIALDMAFQASPDHPWVRDHPEWFRRRPDGTIQYAENPPKKYQDIYPLDFETTAWRTLWEELKGVFLFWIDHGVRIFRVDNPHTKAFQFWEWVIGEIKCDYPDTIFLSEAFTRPKVMYRLAKLGFTQSYTYFAWRNTRWEIADYFSELTQSDVRWFFRPNLWPNTPDILTEYLQFGGRPAFIVRLILAATLGANYGIYGPAFELLEHQPVAPGKEEYLDSEKYEIRHWDIDREDSLKDVITRVNRIRHEHRALQSDRSLRFHHVDNEQLIAYTKATPELDEVVLTVVNLDPYHTHAGWLELPIEEFGFDPAQPYQAHDLLTDARYFWHGRWNYVELNPHVMPAHIMRLRRQVRTEQDFEYFM